MVVLPWLHLSAGLPHYISNSYTALRNDAKSSSPSFQSTGSTLHTARAASTGGTSITSTLLGSKMRPHKLLSPPPICLYQTDPTLHITITVMKPRQTQHCRYDRGGGGHTTCHLLHA